MNIVDQLISLMFQSKIMYCVEFNTLIKDCIYNLCNLKLKKNHGYIPLQIITIGQNNFLIRIA